MKKTKLIAIVLAVMFVLTFGLTACTQHVCQHVCTECGKCTDATCTDPVCKDKCQGHGQQTTGVDPSKDPYLPFAKDTVLRMATGYSGVNTGITFDSGTIGDNIIGYEKDKDGNEDKKKPIYDVGSGKLTLADGNTYRTGDLKPTWVEVQNRLGMTFTSVYQGNSASNEWKYWKEQLGNVDMVSGNAAALNEAGPLGSVVNLADYLDKMPNFKAYLDANPIVRLSITGSTQGNSKGAIYFSPYFDGVNDIERMPLMRTDWVEELLDGDTYHGDNRAVDTSAYKPYITQSYTIESLNATGTGTQVITKTFGEGAKANIIEQMNKASNLTGDQAVAMLRAYIDAMYGSTYAKRSDLFIGYDAAYDADELVALLRCVVASKHIGDDVNKPVHGLFSREVDNNQRQVDLFRFAGTLFGVRGLESRQDYLYVGNDGKLHDARQEADTYVALERMNQMAEEGLIFVKSKDSADKSENFIKNDSGFMHYDYNQTQTAYNTNFSETHTGKYMAVMIPVALWNDGTGVKAMRFTESWRSVKTDGWAISKAGVGDDVNKLNAALKLIDYAYSKEGQILMSYGPDAFIKHDADGKMVMFDFNGEQWPVIAAETEKELWEKAGGNYTNYARRYLGSTLSFVKSQSFEYQCTHEVGREGAAKISAAIAKGTIKHPELAVTENKWYMSVPTVLPTTKEQNQLIEGYTELGNTNFSSSKGGKNVLIDLIDLGYSAIEVTSSAEAVTKVSETWNGKQYLQIKNVALEKLLDFYAEITKK